VRRGGILRSALAAVLCGAFLLVVRAQDTAEMVERELRKPVMRGGMLFKKYCVLCHGERGDGVARAAKLHREMDLSFRERPAQDYARVIRFGGEAAGLSPYMPPWADELSDEQVRDLLAYVAVLSVPARRGEVIFKTNCILCHGINGDGRGRAAQLFNPPPADLTRSQKGDVYRTRIILLGGAAMGRSAVMPAWKDRLSKTEIADLLEYLHGISVLRNPPWTKR